MARKRPSPMEEPPSASSSSEEEEEEAEEEQEQAPGDGDEEEEEEGSEEEEESEEEENQQQKQQKQPPKQLSSPPPKKPEPQQQQQKKKPEPESDSETDSGTESESETDEEDNVAIKTIASRPVGETTPTKKVRSEPSTKKPDQAKVAKRGVEEIEKEKNKDTKRARKESSEVVPASPAVSSPGDAKKTLFQRLWSEDDEIVMLKGMLDFKEKKGIDATKDMSAFYEFIKKSLHCDGTLAQMKDKISRLRRKFEKSVQRGKQGENKKFAREHDQLAFDLSKKIWGSERVGGVESKANGNAKKSLNELKAELGVGKDMDGEIKRRVKFDKDFIRFGGMEEYVVKRGLDAIGAAKRAEMEEKWRKLQAEELKLFVKRNELVTEQAKLMLAAYKTVDDED